MSYTHSQNRDGLDTQRSALAATTMPTLLWTPVTAAFAATGNALKSSYLGTPIG